MSSEPIALMDATERYLANVPGKLIIALLSGGGSPELTSYKLSFVLLMRISARTSPMNHPNVHIDVFLGGFSAPYAGERSADVATALSLVKGSASDTALKSFHNTKGRIQRF